MIKTKTVMLFFFPIKEFYPEDRSQFHDSLKNVSGIETERL